MERKIIIGYDPDHGGDDVLRLGRVVAEVLAARPIVVTVLPWPSYLMDAEDLQKQVDLATQEPFAAVHEELGDLNVETRAIASRSAAEALHESAAEEEAMTIVLGSSHRGAFGRTLVGSVGESLVQGGPCAIAVAPHGYAERSPTRLLRIAVAFDGSPESWAALETGIGLARRWNCQLVVISVADYPHYSYATSWSAFAAGELRDFEREEKERLLELALARIPDDLEREGRIPTGDAGSQLVKASAEFDLIVAGSRAYGPLRRTLLGSSTRKLIRCSACPVLILPRAVGVDPLDLRSGAGPAVHAPVQASA